MCSRCLPTVADLLSRIESDTTTVSMPCWHPNSALLTNTAVENFVRYNRMKNLRFSLLRVIAASTVVATNFVMLMQAAAQLATPTPTPGDKSVAWQNNALHDGNDSSSTVAPPLAVKWQRDFTSAGVTLISYPLIAQGLVIVTTLGTFGKALVAFDESPGVQPWSVPITGSYGFANAAYDAGKVFVINYDGVMQGFDAATGTQLWSVQLPGQYAFTSPPTAFNGVVFVGGAGVGGTLYAVSEPNGAVLWTGHVGHGDDSSPAGTDDAAVG